MENNDENRGMDTSLATAAPGPTPARVDFKSAALAWFHRRLAVIPLVPNEKRTAVKWDSWLAGLSPESIIEYWTAHPTHEVGCIVGDEMIVFDADAPQAVAALAEIEKAFDITPSWVHKTRRGEHHFFRRAPGTFAKSDAHATAEHPERVDIKTGRAMVVLPPSPGKQVDIREADRADELTEASQALIDAVFRLNDRPAPRPTPEAIAVDVDTGDLSSQQRDLRLILQHLTSDLSYHDWFKVLCAGHSAFGGSPEGFELIDSWCAKGSKYPGRAELLKKWQTLGGHAGTPVTVASVITIARDHGVSLKNLQGSNWEDFGPATTEIIESGEPTRPEPTTAIDAPSPTMPKAKPIFSAFSLTGYSAELAKEVQEETFVLAPLALRGQATVWYAAPNAGKTLITLNRLICAIKGGSVDPRQVYYINADDTSQGLLLKVNLAEQYGFNMLAPGHRGFEPEKFLSMLHQASADGTASGTIVILDTVKKFTNLMDKTKATGFTKVVRQFVSGGGTLLGLAHVNKKPGPTGKPVYAGTADIKDDFDCAYVLDVVDDGRESGTRLVEFANEKRRGTVADSVRFSYRAGNRVSYAEMLESVAIVEAAETDSGIPVTAVDLDAEAISVVEHSIRDGRFKKQDLVKALRTHAGLSKRAAEALLERHTGQVSTQSKWNYDVREHGAHCYYLLADLESIPDEGTSDSEAAETIT